MADIPSVLITGGAGYIGSHCCSALRRAGFNPVSFDNLSTGHRNFVNWGPLVVGDVRDTNTLASALVEHRISAVMHFAAASLVGESMIDPGKYYFTNVGGTLSLLEAMRAAGCTKLVFSSTGAVYGQPGVGMISEQAACEPVNPYGRSKLMVERILSDYRAAFDLHAISLRYFNACGAEASGLIGELRNPETHLIPRVLMKLQGHISEFAIFGEDYDTPDGTAIRDYIHVVDLAEAHHLSLKALLKGANGGIFNLGTGVGYSVLEILQVIEQVTGHKVGIVRKARRPGDPAVLIADPEAAQKVLGFKPLNSQLDLIVSSAWAWHRRAHPCAHTLNDTHLLMEQDNHTSVMEEFVDTSN